MPARQLRVSRNASILVCVVSVLILCSTLYILSPRYKLYRAVQDQEVRQVVDLLDWHPELLGARYYGFFIGFGTSPLHLAALGTNTEMAALFLERGENVDTTGEAGETPLVLALIRCREGMVKFLLEHKADPNVISGKLGSTCLHVAVGNNCSRETVALLLDYGANPEVRDINGESPRDNARRIKRDDLVALFDLRGSKGSVVRQGSSAGLLR